MDLQGDAASPNHSGRRESLQWLLERQLAWIAAVEVKAGFVVALDTAMIAGLGVVFMAANQHSTLSLCLTAGVLLFNLLALGCVAFAIFPRTKGATKSSLVYFGDVAKHGEDEFASIALTVTDESFIREVAVQVHRNASIALEKHDLVQKAIACSFLSALAWFGAVTALIRISA